MNRYPLRRPLAMVLVLAGAAACSRAEKASPSATSTEPAPRDTPNAVAPAVTAAATATAAPVAAASAAPANGPASPPPSPAQAARPRSAAKSAFGAAGDLDDRMALGGAAAKEEAAPGAGAKDKKGASKPDSESEPKTWKRAGAATHAARIAIGDREQLPMRGVQMKVDVDGFRARVVVDAYFENDRGSQYEGNFQLRLPDEATPYFFAFGETQWQRADAPVAVRPEVVDPAFERAVFFGAESQRKMGSSPELLMAARASSWRAPKEARIVPKETAAFAFTETARRQVDPALLEWAGAGIFNARVFPIAPHRVHRVVLGYDVNLVRVGNDFEYKLDLPEGVADVAVDVTSASAPIVEPASIRTTDDGGRSYVHVSGAKDRTITFRYPKLGNPIIVGDDPKLGEKRFAANVVVEAAAKSTTVQDRAVFMVDTSLSSNPDRFNVFLKLLKATLNNNRDTMKRFNVAFFNVATSWFKDGWVDNTAENVDALMAYASALSLEGATDLASAFAQAETPSWRAGEGGWDLFLLSDGAATWGESDRNAMAHVLNSSRRGPLFAYNTGLAGTDSAALAFLTRETGGALFSVVGESEIATASTAHRARPFRVVSVKAAGGEDVMIAGRPRTVYPGQSIVVAGRGAPSDIALTLEQGGKEIVVHPPLAKAKESPLAARAYGQIATYALEETGKATVDLAKAYAIHHRVTGETCSLVMLEREEDYLRFNIKPEGEAERVAQNAVGAAVDRAERALEGTLADPKARVVRWLEGLKEQPGMHVTPSPELMAAVQSMPRASFEVAPRPVTVLARTKNLFGGNFLEHLSMPGSLEYDAMTREAESRKAKYGTGDALVALSSLVEQSPGDAILARDVGFSATEMGLPDQGFFLFRRVAASRPWEPQSYRAMADSLARMGMTDLALVYYEVALQGQWDGRFGEFHRIVSVDYLRFLRRIRAGELKTSVPAFAASRIGKVSEEVGIGEADLVVMITWNTDNSDVDLHVTEPTGEDCYYGNRHTKLGGDLTQDVTQGYGPEMYVIKNAKRGEYAVRAHYFAQQRSRASARTKVYAEVIEDWGSSRERVTQKVVTLTEGKDNHDIMFVKR